MTTSPWHVHYTDSGSVVEEYAVGAVMGLAVRLTDVGIDGFGIGRAASCQGVFIDTSPVTADATVRTDA